MSAPPPEEPRHEVIDIRQEEDWQAPLEVTFDQMASLTIANWVLGIFAGVYFLCFVMACAWIGGNVQEEHLEGRLPAHNRRSWVGAADLRLS